MLKTVRLINALAIKRSPMQCSIRNKSAYEGEGKTTVRVLNQEQDLGLMIDTYATYGFKLNNGLTVLGPMAIFSRTVLSWNVADSSEITEDSLRLFKLLEPSIDLLVIGLECEEAAAGERARRAARACGLAAEALPAAHACATFNFLAAEGRCVAGALLPPARVHMNEDDMLRARMHYGDMFNKQLSV